MRNKSRKYSFENNEINLEMFYYYVSFTTLLLHLRPPPPPTAGGDDCGPLFGRQHRRAASATQQACPKHLHPIQTSPAHPTRRSHLPGSRKITADRPRP